MDTSERRAIEDIIRAHKPTVAEIVIVDGVSYLVRIEPHCVEYPDCARAEIRLNKTLRWVEHPDRWDGFHPNGIRLAIVRKSR